MDEAAETYFGMHEGGWWRWIVETGHSLGRNCRVIDGEVQQLVRLARDGVVVILRSDDGQRVDKWTARQSRSRRTGETRS